MLANSLENLGMKKWCCYSTKHLYQVLPSFLSTKIYFNFTYWICIYQIQYFFYSQSHKKTRAKIYDNIMNIDPNTMTELVVYEGNESNAVQQIMKVVILEGSVDMYYLEKYCFWFGYLMMMHLSRNYLMIGFTKIWLIQKKNMKRRR